MRKPALCTDQLRSNREANQCLCFCYIVHPHYVLNIQNFKPLAVFWGCAAQFVLDLVENPKDRFSCNAARMYLRAFRKLSFITKLSRKCGYIVHPLYFLNIQNFKPLAVFCSCAAQFVLDLVENPKDRFSCNAAQMY